MEEFRISNFYARQVEHYGQEKAEEGAALSSDGGDNGGLSDGSYDFKDEHETAKEQYLESEEPDLNANEPVQDIDATQVVMSELERARILGDRESADLELKILRGRNYYSSRIGRLQTCILPEINEIVGSEADTRPEVDLDSQ